MDFFGVSIHPYALDAVKIIFLPFILLILNFLLDLDIGRVSVKYLGFFE